VAYESQLKSDRGELHRRLAAAIEAREPQSADQNAALIAEHLEAAGDGHAAYQWHMRAATWARNRDLAAARLSWERAQKIADALPTEDPHRAALRIAPRTMLCGIAWRVHVSVAGDRFEELRQLCTAAGDKASLAIGMAGLVIDHAYKDRRDYWVLCGVTPVAPSAPVLRRASSCRCNPTRDVQPRRSSLIPVQSIAPSCGSATGHPCRSALPRRLP
jgi:hypothetical protein